jgi:hypothetical protein
MGTILTSPVVAELDAPGDVGIQGAETVDDGVVDRLEGGETIAHLGHVRPRLVGMVVEEREEIESRGVV